MTEKELEELKVTVKAAEDFKKNEKEMEEIRNEILDVQIDSAFLQFDSKCKIDIRLTKEYGTDIRLTDYLDYDELLTIRAELCRFFTRQVDYYKRERERIKFNKSRKTKRN